MTAIEARALLRLPPAFSPRDLKRAYRRAAAANHPDRGGTTERMVAVNEAHDVLSGWSPAWAEEHDYDPFHETQPWTATPEHPSEPYVRCVSIVLAAVWWITGIFDLLDQPRRLRPWILIGLPFAYLIVWVLVRGVVRVGIHVFNVGVWLRERITPAGSWPR